jgi:hypothetical protein
MSGKDLHNRTNTTLNNQLKVVNKTTNKISEIAAISSSLDLNCSKTTASRMLSNSSKRIRIDSALSNSNKSGNAVNSKIKIVRTNSTCNSKPSNINANNNKTSRPVTNTSAFSSKKTFGSNRVEISHNIPTDISRTLGIHNKGNMCRAVRSEVFGSRIEHVVGSPSTTRGNNGVDTPATVFPMTVFAATSVRITDFASMLSL